MKKNLSERLQQVDAYSVGKNIAGIMANAVKDIRKEVEDAFDYDKDPISYRVVEVEFNGDMVYVSYPVERTVYEDGYFVKVPIEEDVKNCVPLIVELNTPEPRWAIMRRYRVYDTVDETITQHFKKGKNITLMKVPYSK